MKNNRFVMCKNTIGILHTGWLEKSHAYIFLCIYNFFLYFKHKVVIYYYLLLLLLLNCSSEHEFENSFENHLTNTLEKIKNKIKINTTAVGT